MIGIFDSGDGGLCTLKKIREMDKNVDVVFLADSKNAPYGTKTAAEILEISANNINTLIDCGAESVLIACCTASSLHQYLPRRERELSLPIIDATVRLAKKKMADRFLNAAVICTEASARFGAFNRSIRREIPNAKCASYPMQELVTLVQQGARDESLTVSQYRRCKEILSKIKNENFDILILGCTHFPMLEKTISSILDKETVSSAYAGAAEILKRTDGCGSGKTIYI